MSANVCFPGKSHSRMDAASQVEHLLLPQAEHLLPQAEFSPCVCHFPRPRVAWAEFLTAGRMKGDLKSEGLMTCLSASMRDYKQPGSETPCHSHSSSDDSNGCGLRGQSLSFPHECTPAYLSSDILSPVGLVNILSLYSSPSRPSS